MRLTAILAIDQAGAIGQTSSPTGLPWPRLARDMQRFRNATMGRVCIVGRKTYDTLPPLPGRRLAVLTRDRGHQFPPWPHPKSVYDISHSSPHSLVTFLRACGTAGDVMVIGGAEVYRALLPLCDRILLTEVLASYPAADVRLGSVASVTDGFTMLSRETFDPDEATLVSVAFSEWARR